MNTESSKQINKKTVKISLKMMMLNKYAYNPTNKRNYPYSLFLNCIHNNNV